MLSPAGVWLVSGYVIAFLGLSLPYLLPGDSVQIALPVVARRSSTSKLLSFPGLELIDVHMHDPDHMCNRVTIDAVDPLSKRPASERGSEQSSCSEIRLAAQVRRMVSLSEVSLPAALASSERKSAPRPFA